MCVFGAIDDPQFKEQQQDQDFGGPDQQQFEEGKWTLDHVFDPWNHQIYHIYFYVHACVYNMMGTKLRTCLVLFTLFLDQLGFNFMLGSYASCYTLGYGWLMMIQMLYLFLSHVHDA